jgi:hypothetical protein
MPANSGTLVAAPITTPASEDTFPTHFANQGKGGMHHAATIAERNAIPVDRRQDGMLCSVSGDGIYMLGSDLTTWSRLDSLISTGVSGDTWVVDYNYPTSFIGASIPAGMRLSSVTCEILVPFDGIGAGLRLGTASDPDAVFSPTDIEITEASMFDIASTLEGPVDLVTTVSPGSGATKGSARIQITLTGA